MGSGRSKKELTHHSKKPRELRRRQRVQQNRLLCLGVPNAVIQKMESKTVRQMLCHPEKVKKRYAGAQNPG